MYVLISLFSGVQLNFPVTQIVSISGNYEIRLFFTIIKCLLFIIVYLCSISPGSRTGDPEVKDLGPFNFSICYKLEFDSPYCPLPQRSTKIKNNESHILFKVKLFQNPIALTLSKWKDFDLKSSFNDIVIS